jgi:hypothetical protein
MVNLQFKNAGKLPNNIHVRRLHGDDPKKLGGPRLAHNEEQVTELARLGDQVRADKVKKIKEQIAADLFQVDSKEVAKSIARRWCTTPHHSH